MAPQCRREHNTFFPHVYNTSCSVHPTYIHLPGSWKELTSTLFPVTDFHHLHLEKKGQGIPEPIPQTRKQHQGRRRSTLCCSKFVRLIYLLLVFPSPVLHLDTILKC